MDDKRKAKENVPSGRQIGYPCRCGIIWASHEDRSRHEAVHHADIEIITLVVPDTIELDEV